MTEFATPRPGEAVLIVFERNGERQIRNARVRECSGHAMRVTFEDGLETGGTPVAVIAGPANDGSFTPIRESVRVPGAMTLVLGSTWASALNRRGMPRYPVFVHCRLEAAGDTETGVCVDISLTGAALEVPHWRHPAFDLILPDGFEEVRAACDTISTEQILGAKVIHVRFSELEPRTVAAIDRIVITARDEFEDMQRLIAHRADDPFWITRSA